MWTRWDLDTVTTGGSAGPAGPHLPGKSGQHRSLRRDGHRRPGSVHVAQLVARGSAAGDVGPGRQDLPGRPSTWTCSASNGTSRPGLRRSQCARVVTVRPRATRGRADLGPKLGQERLAEWGTVGFVDPGRASQEVPGIQRARLVQGTRGVRRSTSRSTTPRPQGHLDVAINIENGDENLKIIGRSTRWTAATRPVAPGCRGRLRTGRTSRASPTPAIPVSPSSTSCTRCARSPPKGME